MRKKLPSLFGCGLLGLFPLGAFGQARPTASGPGFALPEVAGSLRYSLSASESLTRGLYANNETVSSTNLSGNLAFTTPGASHPFKLIESGGYSFSNSDQPSSPFENLVVEQTLLVGRWSVTANDGLTYLPVTASTGLAGLPGLGDLNATVPTGGTTVTAPGAGLGILSLYGPRLNNASSLGISRPLTGSLSFQATGTYSLLRYLGGTNAASNGIDDNSENGTIGLNYRIDARSSTGVSYFYNKNDYIGQQFSFTTQGVTGYYSRQVTRRVTAYVSGGPLKLSGSSAALSQPSLNFNAAASINYVGKQLTHSLNYVRTTTTGSGVIEGDIADTLSYGVNRTFGQRLGVAASIGYARSHSVLLTQPFLSEGVTASVQVTQALSRHVSGFASYTYQNQSIGYTTVLNNALRGTYQVASFGITYSPSVHRLGAQ